MESGEAKLIRENEELKRRLGEAEQTLQAMQKGEVDAIVVKGPKGDQIYSLVSPDHPYQIFIESMHEAALILSKEGTILYANRGFMEMVGYANEKVIGVSILNFLEESQRADFLGMLFNLEDRKYECTFVNRKLKRLDVSLGVSPGTWENSESYCLLLNDITSLKRAQRLIEASEMITKILSETATLSTVCKLMIGVLNKYLGWEVLVVWFWNQEGQILDCGPIAQVEGLAIDDFINKTRSMNAEKGTTMTRVWSSYRPSWIEDVTKDPAFLRKNEAKKGNLHGSFAFPFFQESHLGGVIELFRQTPFDDEIDDQILNLFTSIGIGFGLFVRRQLAEEAILQFSTVVSYSVNGVYSTDRNGIVKTWNPSAERIYGWNASEMIGSNIKKIYPAERVHEFNYIFETLLSGKIIDRFETQRARKDGTLIWVRNAYGPTKNSSGEVTGTCVLVEDISKEKKIFDALSASEEKFKTYMEISDEWIWEIDRKGDFTFSNRGVERLLGFKVEEILGKSFFSFLPRDAKDEFERRFADHVQMKKGWVREPGHFFSKEKRDVWTQSNIVELLDRDGKLIGFRGATRDVSEMVNVDRIKNEFISIVSHELRTPLASVIGALALLKPKISKEKETEELLCLALRNSERLSKIVNDILDVEKLQIGNLDIQLKEVRLDEIVDESVRSAQIMANPSRVTLQIEGLLPKVKIKGDSDRLHQLMANLLSNAVKFSPSQGTVHVEMQLIGPMVRVLVRDHGPGIPKEFASKIFQQFSQADSSSQRSSPGVGLGLSISKRIVELHGGTIQYETNSEGGATFFFDLPLLSEG